MHTTIDILDSIQKHKRIYRVRCGADLFLCDERKDAIRRATILMQIREDCGLKRYPTIVTCETIIWVDGDELNARRKGERNNG